MLRALGVGLTEAAAACAGLTPVPGRMQRVAGAGAAGQPEIVVDYAHTPDALEKALAALRPLAAERGGKLWCVFGCGGNRDAAKRPLMGAIAVRHAEHVVLTSDNPRLESADFILSQILVGAIGHDEVDVIENRAAAIRRAVLSAAPADVILIAGKGHEDYQDVGGVKHPFVDAVHAAEALASRRTAAAAAPPAPMATLGEFAASLPGARCRARRRSFLAGAQRHPSLRPGDLFVALGASASTRTTSAGAGGRLRRSAGRARSGRGRAAGPRVADSRLASASSPPLAAALRPCRWSR